MKIADLGELYYDLGDNVLAVKFMCRGLIEKIDSGNIFVSALILKKIFDLQLVDAILLVAEKQAFTENNLWKQVRILSAEKKYKKVLDLLLEHQEEIESSGNPILATLLASALGDDYRIVEAEKNLARLMHEGYRAEEDQTINDDYFF